MQKMNDNSFPLINEADERLADEHRVHEVYSPVGLWRMVYEPTDTFRLIGDIDMQGERWFPVAFRGRLEGCGHTISNLRIGDSIDGCEGFFTKLGKKARITDVTFENVQIFCDGAAVKIGAICGENQGVIENCTVKHAVFRDAEGKTPFSRAVGIAAGKNSGTVSMTGRTSAAFLLQNAQTGLCGENGGTVEGFWQDLSNATEFASETERDMRRKVVDKMFQMATFQWKLDETMEYNCSCGAAFCKHCYVGGRQHFGLPYTHHSGSVERMRGCFKKIDSRGKKAQTLLPFAAAPLDPSNGDLKDFSAYIGNDCSGAVYWAWATASADISFRWTWQMIPTEDNCREYGVVKLGHYTCGIGNQTIRENDNVLTDPVTGEDHPEVLYEAYRLARKGDALVHLSQVRLLHENGNVKVGRGGHTILICADPVVIRDAEGAIDPKRSHILTNEQGSPMGRVDTSWTLGGVWSFDQLAYRRSMKSKKGWQLYVPITTHALQNGRPDEAKLHTNGVTSPVCGIVSSNFRINSTAAVVLDEKGRELARDTQYTGIAGFDQKQMEFEGTDETGHFEVTEDVPKDYVCRTTYRSVDLGKHAAVLDGLKEGSYGYRVEVLLANGETKTVCGRFIK